STKYPLGGYELRYTDDSWGIDDGKNLIGRYFTSGFSIPRNQRSKAFFIRQFNYTNLLQWSEDLNNAVWVKTNTTVANSTATNPDGEKSTISTVTPVTGSKSVAQVTAIPTALSTFVGTVSLKGTAGQQVTVQVSNEVDQAFANTVTLTGQWQRVSV